MRSAILRGKFMNAPFDRVAEVYDQTRSHSSAAMTKIIETLKRELEDSARILDVGAGTGRYSEPLQTKGLEVIGIDISRRMLGKAREKGTKILAVADARALPFRDSCFDSALSVHLLHLTREWEAVLNEVLRVTKDYFISIGWENSEGKISPGIVYKELLEKHEYHHDHPGLAEPRLSEFVKPVKREFITKDISNTERSLGHLNDRVYGMQWGVPDDLHERVMKELRREFEGKVEYSNDIYLFKWRIADIRRYLDRKTSSRRKRGM
jgi:ubiquinone/menaquinone biosynthesis C-methylase UbiE